MAEEANRISGSRKMTTNTFLAYELRKMIFDYALRNEAQSIGAHRQLLSFIVAFAPFVQTTADVADFVKMTKFVLNGETVFEFKNLRSPKLGYIQHLTIELSDTYEGYGRERSLNASIIFGTNYLTTICVDLTGETDTRERSIPTNTWIYPTSLKSNLEIIKWLVNASRPGVRKLVVVLNLGNFSVHRRLTIVPLIMGKTKGTVMPTLEITIVKHMYRVLTFTAPTTGEKWKFI